MLFAHLRNIGIVRAIVYSIVPYKYCLKMETMKFFYDFESELPILVPC